MKNKNIEIRRLCLTIGYDSRQMLRTMYDILLVFATILALSTIRDLMTGIPPSAYERGYTIRALIGLTCILAPSRIYRNCNTPNTGILLAMLPASKAEKYISMIITTFLTMPITATLLYLATDSLTMIGRYTFPNIFAQTSSGAMEAVWTSILTLFNYIAFFVMCTTIFKKGKFAKSLLTGLIICIIILVNGWKILDHLATTRWDLFTHESYIIELRQLMENYSWTLTAASIGITIIFILAGAFKMKRARY